MSPLTLAFTFMPLLLAVALSVWLVSRVQWLVGRGLSPLALFGGLVLALGIAMGLQVVLPTIPGLFYYDGTCYGFTDGQWECSFAGFLKNELSLSLVLSTVFLGILLVVFLVTVAFALIRHRLKGGHGG